jgi:hypothetical protein
MEGPEPIMTTNLAIVEAFVDGERVDTQALKAALAQPDARDYLAELLALRELVAHSGSASAQAAARPSRRWLIGAAAAVVLSLGSGYALGLGSGLAPRPDGSAVSGGVAPQPTRVIEVAPGASYVSNVSQGGR